MPTLELRFLGGYRILQDGSPLPDLKSRKGLALLCYLAVTQKCFSRSALAGLFWPDMPESEALMNLRKVLNRLKPVSPLLAITRETVAFNREAALWLDVGEFETEVADRPNIPCLQEAVSLYQGDFLEGFACDDFPSFYEWVLSQRARLREAALNGLQALITYFSERQDYTEAIQYARQLLAIEPWQEETHRELIRLLAFSGQRSAALAQYETCRRLLADELGVKPGAETVKLVEAIRDGTLKIPNGTAQPGPKPNLPRHNLPPQLTSFIGREKEITEVGKLVRENRLVTLTGSGGVGKTRLAIQAVEGTLAEIPDGVWYVELAPLSDPELVPQTVAAVLGLREEPSRPFLETLATFLNRRELLLVLDNCEHLLEACARLADILLRKAPMLRILATSREILGIAGECPFHVPSLAIPGPQQKPSLEALREYEAVQLFAERVRVVLPSFQVDEHNAQAVAQICQRLDGIPLAIELAASRLNLLTTEQLAGRLDQAFLLLTGGSRTALPRHQTLRATIDWSYQLLSDSERRLLCRLAVFAGGAALEGIEAICAGEDLAGEYILNLLSGLVSKSMVSAERKQGVETRYRLLETVRQFAREKLVDSGESEWLRGRHLDYYEALCQEAHLHIHSAGRLEWTRRLKREYDNIREALEWAFQDATLALKGLHIATTLRYFWLTAGLYREGHFWLNAGLQAVDDQIPRLLKADVLFCITNFLPGDRRAAFEQCIALCREIGPEADRVLCRALRYGYYVFDYQETLAHEEEAVQLARGIGPAGSWELGDALFFYSLALYMHPEGVYDDQALAAAQESLQVHQAGDRWNVPAYWTIGMIQALRGQDEQARQSLETALEVFSETNDFIGLTFTSFDLALIHRLAGRYELAQQSCQRIFQTADAVANEDGHFVYLYAFGMLLVNRLNDPRTNWNAKLGLDAVRLIARTKDFPDSRWYVRFKSNDLVEIERLRSKLGEEAYLKAWKEGEALTLEQAVALAREVKYE